MTEEVKERGKGERKERIRRNKEKDKGRGRNVEGVRGGKRDGERQKETETQREKGRGKEKSKWGEVANTPSCALPPARIHVQGFCYPPVSVSAGEQVFKPTCLRKHFTFKSLQLQFKEISKPLGFLLSSFPTVDVRTVLTVKPICSCCLASRVHFMMSVYF